LRRPRRGGKLLGWGTAATAAKSSPLPDYTFDVWGWEDANGDRWTGEPFNIQDTYGIWVHVYNPDNPEDSHPFWAFTPEPYEDWEEWWDYIGILAAMHGYVLA